MNAEELSALGYRAGWQLVHRLPPRVAHSFFRCVADRASADGRGPEQLRRNLTRVVGAENVTRALVRDSMRSYLRYWCEAFRLPAIHRDPQLIAQLEANLEGREHLERSLAAGRGVVLALPHTGNWDMAGVLLVHLAGGFTTVAERLRPESLFDDFVAFRESLGFDVIPHTGGATRPFAHLKDTVQRGGAVALLAERDLTRTGVPVTFFGEPATMAAGPAQLAIETGAALHVVHLWYPGSDSWGTSVSPALKVDTLARTTQRMADHFAANIARHPADWHMLQPLWTADVDQRRRRHHQLSDN